MNVLSTNILWNKKGKSGEIPPWLIVVVLAAVFLLPQSPLNILSIFNPGSFPNERQATLPDGNQIIVKTNGFGLGFAASFVGNTMSLISQATTDKPATSAMAQIILLNSLKDINNLTIEGNAQLELGTSNFPSNGVLLISVEDKQTKNVATLFKRGINGGRNAVGGIVIIDPISRDYRFADEFSEGVSSTGQPIDDASRGGKNVGVFGDVSILIPEQFRSDDYKLIIDFAVVGGAYSTASIIYTINGIKILGKTSPQLKKQLCEVTKGTYSQATGDCTCPVNSKGFVSDIGCSYTCAENEVKLFNGGCKVLIRTCIDNDLNNICDADDPVVYRDPDSNAPICSDRNNDKVCDDVASLFCKDENNNQLCDSDEVRWYSTYCPDTNGNGVCDGIESGTVLCPIAYNPVCDPTTNITFPNSCFASGFGITAIEVGACKVPPIIIRLDCATGDVPIPSGYTCNPETGWLIKTEKIYIDVFTDCRNLGAVEGYTCTDINGQWVFVKTIYLNQTLTVDCRVMPPETGYTCKNVGSSWVYTKTEFVNIDCYSTGCPSNSLCQGGICVTSAKRCPEQVSCATTYGSDTSCDAETGLCVKKQYETLDCGTLGCPLGSECVKSGVENVCLKTINQTTPIFEKLPVFGEPRKTPWSAIVIIVLVVAGAVVLAAKKR